MYLYSLLNMEGGDKFNNKYEERVREYIATLARGSQTPIQAVPIQVDGWNF